MEGQKNNSCYTYFKITGDFNPDDLSQMLKLTPEAQWKTGDLRRNGTKLDFAHWEYGRCTQYDIYIENQMMKTIEGLLPKVEVLQKIKQKYDVTFSLVIVPTLYAGKIDPCLAPNKKVIQFCYETDTDIDIDLYILDSAEEEEEPEGRTRRKNQDSNPGDFSINERNL